MGVVGRVSPIWYTIVGSLVWHVVAILFGAPLLESAKETYFFGLIASICTISLPSLYLDNWWDVGRVYLERDLYSDRDYILYCSTVGGIAGAWFGAFPIPLDWDRPWQKWPITCVVGTISGFFVGLIVGKLVYKYSRVSKKSRVGKSV